MSLPQDDLAHQMHYAFAHRHLPEMAFTEPQLILAAAFDGRLPTILNRIWTDMQSQLPEDKRRIGEIKTEFKQIEEGILILIYMPEPQIPPEAKVVALSFQKVEGQTEPLTHCLALELSYDNSYAIGSWSRERNHGNFGRAEGDTESFTQFVLDFIRDSKQA